MPANGRWDLIRRLKVKRTFGIYIYKNIKNKQNIFEILNLL